jgi:hypothetical protein
LDVRFTGVVAALGICLVLFFGAQAQSLDPGVSVEGEASEGTVTVEQVKSFRFTVKNTSPTSGTPFDAEDKAWVNVTFEGVPLDWTVSATPQSFRLGRGEAASVDVQVSVATGSSAKEANIMVVATLTPVTAQVPIPAPIPVPGTEPVTAEAPIHLRVDDSFTRDVMEALGPWIYVLLLLLVAAIVVAIGIAVASRRTLVRLTADGREASIPPGGKVAFVFRVESLAKDTDTALLQVSAVPEGWAAFLPVPELVLEPGQPQEVNLVVIAPRGAAQGTRQAILVTATSAKAPRGAANLEFIATVEGIEELPTAPRRAK